MKPRLIRARVPATTSNLGPGFDVLGMALSLHNELELTWETGLSEKPLSIEIAGEGADTLPRGAKNLVARSLRMLLPRKFPHALRLRLTNRIPISRGLGSSAAARLSGLLAGWELSGRKQPLEEVLKIACRCEGHPDNAVAALYGGLCASFWDGKTLRHFRIAPPQGLVAVICAPDIEVTTTRARAILPKTIPFQDAVRTSSGLALLLGALERRRFDWLQVAMQDVLHQPYRKILVPGLEAVIANALSAGAFGAALSGSGSSVLALSTAKKAPKIGLAMQAAFSKRRIESRSRVLRLEQQGAQVRTDS